MSLAQDRLASLVAWVNESSQSYPFPIGTRTTVLVGPYATFVPLALDHAPTQQFVSDVLPIFIPASQSIPNLPSAPETPPESQDHAGARLCHLVWKFQGGLFVGALLPLFDPDETLQTVLEREAPDLDLTTHPALFLPMWDLDNASREWALANLPFISP